VVSKYPDEFEPCLEVKDFKVFLTPVLMNPGDKVRISILAAIPATHQLVVGGRIAGVASLQIYQHPVIPFKERLQALFFLCLTIIPIPLSGTHFRVVGITITIILLFIVILFLYSVIVERNKEVR